jgi:hypothetical protein
MLVPGKIVRPGEKARAPGRAGSARGAQAVEDGAGDHQEGDDAEQDCGHWMVPLALQARAAPPGGCGARQGETLEVRFGSWNSGWRLQRAQARTVVARYGV